MNRLITARTIGFSRVLNPMRLFAQSERKQYVPCSCQTVDDCYCVASEKIKPIIRTTTKYSNLSFVPCKCQLESEVCSCMRLSCEPAPVLTMNIPVIGGGYGYLF